MDKKEQYKKDLIAMVRDTFHKMNLHKHQNVLMLAICICEYDKYHDLGIRDYKHLTKFQQTSTKIGQNWKLIFNKKSVVNNEEFNDVFDQFETEYKTKRYNAIIVIMTGYGSNKRKFLINSDGTRIKCEDI